MTYSDQAFKAKKGMIAQLIGCLSERFDGNYNEEVIAAMSWMDPCHWSSDRNNGVEDLGKLYSHFQSTLDNAGYQHHDALNEWVSFKSLVRHVEANTFCRELWKKVLKYKRRQFHNLISLSSRSQFQPCHHYVVRQENIYATCYPSMPPRDPVE